MTHVSSPFIFNAASRSLFSRRPPHARRPHRPRHELVPLSSRWYSNHVSPARNPESIVSICIDLTRLPTPPPTPDPTRHTWCLRLRLVCTAHWSVVACASNVASSLLRSTRPAPRRCCQQPLHASACAWRPVLHRRLLPAPRAGSQSRISVFLRRHANPTPPQRALCRLRRAQSPGPSGESMMPPSWPSPPSRTHTLACTSP